MRGYLTSYARLFEEQPSDAPPVGRIEIPLIQRDYAQGRLSVKVDEIRATFLDVLLEAMAGGDQVGLDFIYGRVDGGTTFRPLDGQQRLTTLFLLHWYLASRVGLMDQDASWAKFSYATRPSARLFCERLVCNPLIDSADRPSEWIVDQPWYLATWRSDPTIQAMLVMLDAMHDDVRRRPALNVHDAWERLTSDATPAVSFYLLPLDDLSADEDLYIKMNSRGKPLTPFENFKAMFERDIEFSHRAAEFAHKIDGSWSELFWPYRGADNIVDDEFVRYIGYIVEMCEFREDSGTEESGPLGTRARAVFGAGNSRAAEHLDFLFEAFDCWRAGPGVADTMDAIFEIATPGAQGYDPSKVVMFTTATASTTTNLFEECLKQFGTPRGNGRGRMFTLQQSLLLYAVLLHLIHGTDDFPRRLRVLRNLIAASEDQIRRDAMPALVMDVEAVVRSGDLDTVTAMSANQIEDERRKSELLRERPDLAEALFRLEDHSMLRGALSAFDLEPDRFERRAEAFDRVFADKEAWLGLTGALLATGDYQRQPPRSTLWQFGTSSPNSETVWRYLLTGTTEAGLAKTRTVLAEFLDGFVASGQSPRNYFESVMSDWLSRREDRQEFDWRYYLVKYPSMRSGDTGIYYGVDGEMTYTMCMLRRSQLNSNYRDPILLEVWQRSGIGDLAQDPWYTGWDTTPRWLRLRRSGIGLRSVEVGFEIEGVAGGNLDSQVADICRRHGSLRQADEGAYLMVPKITVEQGAGDTVDRVELGAALLRDLTAAGY